LHFLYVRVFTAVRLRANARPTTWFADISNLRTANSYDIFEADNFWLSGKMLIFLIILCLIAAASAATLYLRRTKLSSEMLGRQTLSGAENFRPLFEPSKTELQEKERLLMLEKQAEADRQKQLINSEYERELADWIASPNRSQTILLLSNAAKSENEHIYVKACKEVLRIWRAGSVDDLSANDLAQLMESHYWLIPAEKRTPGASFLIKEEIAGLRRGSLHNK
jgi:hypothetical protein